LERGAIKLIWCGELLWSWSVTFTLIWSVWFTLIMISSIHAYHDQYHSRSVPFTLIMISEHNMW
jgi:hypothetical protein